MKNIIYISLFTLVAIMSSCGDEIPLTLQEDYIGFDQRQIEFLYLRIPGDPTPVASGMQVQLIGAQRSTPTTVNFEVDATATTAIAGLHYNLVGTSLSIPANSNFGELPIEIIPDNINGGEVLDLALEITGGDAGIDGAFKTVTYKIAILCPSDINTAVTYDGSSNVSPDFGVSGAATVTLSKESDNTYRISDVQVAFLTNFGGFEACNMESVIVQDVCNSLSIINGDPDGNNCSNWATSAADGFGPGSYDPVTGNISLPIYSTTYGFGIFIEYIAN